MQAAQLEVGYGRWCDETVKKTFSGFASRQQWCELGSLLRDMSPRQMRAVRQNCTKKGLRKGGSTQTNALSPENCKEVELHKCIPFTCRGHLSQR